MHIICLHVLCANIFTIHKLGHASHTFFLIPPTLNEGVACEDYQKLFTVFAVIQAPPQYKSHSVPNLIFKALYLVPHLFLEYFCVALSH